MELDLLLNTIKNLVEYDMEVTSNVVQKGNVFYTGISIGKGSIRPTVYMENYEDLFQEKGCMAVAEKMIEDCNSVVKPNIDIELCSSWNYVKDNILLCIAPYGTNNGNVTIPYLDLELYFRVDLKNAGVQDGTFRVSKNIFDTWEITKEELLETALSTNKYIAESMRETMIQMMFEDGMPEEIIEDFRNSNDPDQTLISNANKLHGAAAIYDKSLLKEVADKYESDLYIIPSSIHELIAAPTENVDKEDIDRMIQDVNRTQLEPSEILSDHAYIFRRDTMDIEW